MEPIEGIGEVRQVVFVCSGNTCRSPMAEALARRAFAALPCPPTVSSAGVAAADGLGAADCAIEALRRMGVSLHRHRSRPLERIQPTIGTLVLTMEPWQAHRARALLPSYVWIEPLLSLLTRWRTPVGSGDAVEDPAGQPLEVYLRVASLLNEAVATLATHFADRPTGPSRLEDAPEG